MRLTSRLFIVAAALAASVPSVFSQPKPAASSAAESFSASVPAAGTNTVIMPVTRWGRYSLRCSGTTPVSLTVSDRRSGYLAGCEGDSINMNPRVDLFLEIGEYKLTVKGKKKARGNETITAVPYSYVPDFKPAYLVPLRENRLTLNDCQQTAFWFEVTGDTTVYIEATGRNLDELALWLDGEWLVQTSRSSFESRPRPETPLRGLSISARVSKGTYMVAAYGGKGTPWAVQSSDHPLYVQWGLAPLDANIISALTIPPKGYTRLLLAPSVTAVVMEAPDKTPLHAEISKFENSFSSGSWLAKDSIHRKLSTPRILLQTWGDNGERAIKIAGTPGQRFSLQTVGTWDNAISGKERSSWWVSSQTTGTYTDQFGASGLVIDTAESILALQADTVSDNRTLAKRFNLLETITAFIWVENDGKYSITTGDLPFQWRMGRFFYSPPPNYMTPDQQTGSGSIEISRGLYLLEISPVKKGIATITIQKSSIINSLFSAGKAAISGALGSAQAKQQWTPPCPAITFPNLSLSPKNNYIIFLNSQSPELSGLAARKLPVNPDTPFCFWIKPLEKLQIPATFKNRRLVSLSNRTGAPVPFEIKGKRYDKPAEIEAGACTIVVSGSGSEAQCLILRSTPPELLPQTSPPAFPDEKKETLPKFPALVSGTTEYFDLDRVSTRPFAVQVKEPGLYRIETTGRLRTGIALRDRFLHFTRNAQQNGVGRNALLTEYLLPGEYQVTAGTLEQSAGRLGLALYRTPLAAGGTLEPGIDNRNYVETFSGVDYTVRVPSNGKYRVESFGQNGNFPMRLEDAGGWPFEPAVSSEPLEVALSRNQRYHLISLPQPQEGRRIARLAQIKESKTITGKGPHELELNTTLSSTWSESGKKGDTAMIPAVFLFTVPAPISASLRVSEGFNASLLKRADKGVDSTLLRWSGRKKIDLAAGRYRVDIVPDRRKNYVPYEVAVYTRDLVPGLSYSVSSAETFRVSLGNASIVELGSQGQVDVAATLYDNDGKTVIAANDDGFLDWNFSISRALKAGRYFLRMESAEDGFSSASTVFMRAFVDSLMDSLSPGSEKAPAVVQCDLNRRLGVFPLKSMDTGEIIACEAAGRSHIGLAIEKTPAGREVWQPVSQQVGDSPALSLPRAKGFRYRLKVWSATNMDETITLSYLSASARYVSWKQMDAGLSGQPLKLGGDYRAWYKLELGAHAPGHFRVACDRNTISKIGATVALDSAFINESASWFSAASPYCWVEIHFEQSGKYSVSIKPLALEHRRPVSIPLVGGNPRFFETQMSKGSIALLSVETDGYNPLAAMTSSSGAKPGQLKLKGMNLDPSLWTGEGRAAVVSLFTDERRAAIWNSLPPQDGLTPPALVTWNELPLLDAGVQSPGISSWSIGYPSARVTHCAKGTPVRIRVTLPPGGAVLVTRTDGSRALECSYESEPIIREFVTEGGDLYLLAPKDSAKFDVATYALAAADLSSALTDQTVTPGIAWQTKLAREGALLLPFTANDRRPLKLFFRGAVRSVGWIGSDGMLRPDLADGSAVRSGGFLKVVHSEGWAKIDLCDDSTAMDVMACKWGSSTVPSNAIEISQSSLVALHDIDNWFSFVISDTQHVNLSTPLPLAAILLRDGKPFNYQEAWELFNWDLPLPPGKYSLGVRKVAGSSLEGGRLSILFRPIVPITEKKPFTAYMGPGESRLLWFSVVRKSDFGIGLRMTRETVQARLYDVYGNQLNQGKQQFLNLKPGRYYLWLRVGAASEGSEVTARIFGQEPPPNEPPEQLVKWIINGEEGPRPNTETVGGEDEPKDQRPAWQKKMEQSGEEQQPGYQEENPENQVPQQGSTEYNQGSEGQENSEGQQQEQENNPNGQESGGEGNNEGGE